MRVFKYRTFCQWAKSEKISDSSLKMVINEIEGGSFEAYLGSGLYKKRVARSGHGKRGGYRVIIAYKQEHRAVFMYGFAKNERENITGKEEYVYKKLAKYFVEITGSQLDVLLKNGELFEVTYEISKEK